MYNKAMKKHYIDVILEKELIRNENMQKAYLELLEKLPKGSLIVRKINGNEYCYFSYKENGKVISKYAGLGTEAEIYRAQIEQREHLKQLLKMLKDEYKRIKKMEEI